MHRSPRPGPAGSRLSPLLAPRPPRPADLSAHLGQWARGLAAPEKLEEVCVSKTLLCGEGASTNAFGARKSEAPALGDFWIFFCRRIDPCPIGKQAVHFVESGLLPPVHLID